MKHTSSSSDEMPGGSAPCGAGDQGDWQEEYVLQLEDETGWDPEAPRVWEVWVAELLRENRDGSDLTSI